jgi:hypothetical protein
VGHPAPGDVAISRDEYLLRLAKAGP